MVTLREAVAEGGPGSLEWARLGLVSTYSLLQNLLIFNFNLIGKRSCRGCKRSLFSNNWGVGVSSSNTICLKAPSAQVCVVL